MIPFLVPSIVLAQSVPNVAPAQKLVGFECRDEYKTTRRRINVDLADHVWQDQDGSWYKIAAETANTLSLMNWRSDDGSHKAIDLDRFKLKLNESQYIAPANMVFVQSYSCRMGPPIDMTAGRKF